MSNYVIITDSSCDLSAELRERFGIADYVKSVFYWPDGREGRSDLEWSQIQPKEFYTSMKDKKTFYKTAGPTAGDVEEVYEKYLQQGQDILAITLSTGISVTYATMKQVADDMMKKYPERKIVVVDSLRYSTCEGLLVALAGMKRMEGATLEENAEYVAELRHCIHQSGPMDDLFFLKKMGRVKASAAFFGTMIGIRPMADMNRHGVSEVLGKVKGKKAAFEATYYYFNKTAVNPSEQILFVAHSDREEDAKAMAKYLEETYHPKDIIINSVGMSCGASIGPGLCAVFYVGKPVSENLVEERAIVNEAIASTK